MTKDEIIDGYLTTIQITVGEIIDIYENFTEAEKEWNKNRFDKALSRNPGSIKITTLRESVSFAKENPSKGYCLVGKDKQLIKEFLLENGIEESRIAC